MTSSYFRPNSSGTHFVFLQGMPSPFFSRIANKLEARGCRVTGINLCIGDWIFWRGSNTVNYRGRLSDWQTFIGDYLVDNQVTDIVLLGEQRSYHKLAIEAAHARGVRVTVTDFGYLRPDWITLERDGMSGNSRFTRDPAEILRLAAVVPNTDLAPRYADSALKMAIGDLVYIFSNVFFGWLFPHYRRSDMRPHPIIYVAASMMRRLQAMAGIRRRTLQQLQSIADAGLRYFVFPLQLEHDFQIVAYSPFNNLDEPIRMVLKSFAEHADAGTRLLVKVHPWEPGLKNWRKLVSSWAKEFDIADRVVYLDGGDLDAIIKGSVGMVTVNSTSGIRALQLGCPVKIFGEAIYDVRGLTHQGGLDGFWRGPQVPDPVLVDGFVKAIAACIQIRGVFFSEPGLSAAVDAAAERLYSKSVGLPAD